MSTTHWIKVKKMLPDSPKMRAISRICECSTAEAFLGWFKLYCYFDSHTADGKVEYFGASDIDYVSGLPKLGEALETVGWVKFNAQDCMILDWEKHNGHSAKHRLLQSERQVKSRKSKEL